MENEQNIVTEEKPKVISFFTHEYEVARMERTNKRLWILCLVIFFAFVVSNLIWIRYEMSMEDVVMTQEVTTDGGGDAIAHGVGVGDINNYGESETDN